jgi:hypothetical protein
LGALCGSGAVRGRAISESGHARDEVIVGDQLSLERSDLDATGRAAHAIAELNRRYGIGLDADPLEPAPLDAAIPPTTRANVMGGFGPLRVSGATGGLRYFGGKVGKLCCVSA